jgi:hypothetical protein
LAAAMKASRNSGSSFIVKTASLAMAMLRRRY